MGKVVHFVGILALVGLVVGALSPSLATAQSTQQVTITLREFTLTPAKITVRQGQPVQFTVINAGTVEHNFTVELPAQNIEKTLFAANLRPGETRTAEYTFPAAGDWEMYCPVDTHEDQGMKGEITVQAAGGAPGAAAMPKTGGLPDPVTGIAALLGLIAIGGGLALRHRR